MRIFRTIFLTVIALAALTAGAGTALAHDVTISAPTLFTALDGGPDDHDGLANGCFTVNDGSLTITATGSIIYNDTGVTNPDSAGNICALISSNLDIFGSILAQNNVTGGAGGNITLTAGGDLVFHNGATVSSHKGGGNDAASAGDITITGNGLNSSITVAAGALIEADSRNQAGAITIDSTGPISIDGTVRSGFTSTGNTTNSKGGPITITSDCTLTVGDTGVVSSEGRDAGADLVHLEGCDVFIYGLVQSTGPGHNHGNIANNTVVPRDCFDSDGGNESNATRPDKPATSTACVEIWAGGDLTIDRTGTHNGEINADTALSGGGYVRAGLD